MKLEIIPAYDQPLEVGLLFSEYSKLLVTGEPSFKGYLDIQGFDAEIKDVKEKYGLPWGRLYLAYYDGELAGCIGLKKMDEQNCEMKRLYVRPEFRGKKIGSRLVEKILADAKDIGYSHMLLDTLPFLEAALHMYKKYGFYEIECYNNNPLDNAIYMKLDL